MFGLHQLTVLDVQSGKDIVKMQKLDTSAMSNRPMSEIKDLLSLQDEPSTPFVPTPAMHSNPLTTTAPQVPQQQANASSDSTSAVTGNKVAARLHAPASAANPQDHMPPAVGSTMAAAEQCQSNAPSDSPAVLGSNQKP